MLTYQLHTRVFQIETGTQFDFPNKVHIEIKCAPAPAFGCEDGPSRTLVRGHAASVRINANTGRWTVQSQPPLETLVVTLKSPTTQFRLDGDVVAYDFECDNLEDLEGVLVAFKWILPTLLNLEFADPVVIEYIRGQVGETTFRWEHVADEWRISMRPVTANELEKHVAYSVEALSLFNGTGNRRLAAALSYFHTATRLAVCGDSPWEFMAESILNFAKCLDILFVTSQNTRDDVRNGLATLDYTDEEIEGDFIPILILRSYIDVAHPRVRLHKRRHLQILYRYIASAEENVRQLLRRIVSKVQDGSFVVHGEEQLSMSSEDCRDMERLVERMESRLTVGS